MRKKRGILRLAPAAIAVGILMLLAWQVQRVAVAQSTSVEDPQASLASAGDEAARQRIQQALRELVPSARPDAIKPSAVPGLYEITLGAEVIYMTEDGRYLLEGDVMDVRMRRNLTEETRAHGRLKLMESVDTDTMIIFAPEKKKHVVTVFTDIDCPYCRKMHGEMAQYTDRGIEIRYLAFPRAGINSKSYVKAVSVWCAEDKNSAMTMAKAGQTVETRDCANPVTEHMALANDVGVTGTPSLVLENGHMFPGYVPAQRLSEMLDQFTSTSKK